MAFEKELEVARRAASQSAQLALRKQAAGYTVDIKPDNSPVTSADRECELRIAQIVTDAFPEDGLLGEEGALRESRNGRRWIIDPIDGTRDFIRGNPLWAVLIGFESDGEVCAGVAHLPLLGKMFTAGRGAGAYRNDIPIRVSSIDKASEAVFSLNGLNLVGNQSFAPRVLNWMSQFWAVRNLGGAPDAMMVASGEVDVWMEPAAAAWDLAPLKVIVEEAGGRFFNFDGRSSIYGGNCVACVPALEGVVKEFLGSVPGKSI